MIRDWGEICMVFTLIVSCFEDSRGAERAALNFSLPLPTRRKGLRERLLQAESCIAPGSPPDQRSVPLLDFIIHFILFDRKRIDENFANV